MENCSKCGQLWKDHGSACKTPDPVQKQAQRCPICVGNGLVMQGFYNQVGGSWLAGGANFEECKSCKVTGVVWEQ